MTKLKNINVFFNELRLSAGAIWVDNDKIKFSAPKAFQNQETNEFINTNKNQIIKILQDNNILSDKEFLKNKILKDTTQLYFPLSFAQERLWFIEQYEQGANAYHMPGLFELDAETDKEGIKYALQQIVSRHEILRSTIEQIEDHEHGVQKIHDEALPIKEVSVMATDDYQSMIEEDINRPFNLSTEYPIRITFYTIESAADDLLNKTILLITTHHIASDGWSMEVFQRELSAYYEAYINNNKNFSLPELEIQYKDYALWQRDYLAGEVLEKQLSYWKEKLSGFQTLEFPTDYARPAEIDYRGDHQEFALDKELSQKLRSLAHQSGITLNSLMLSSVNILLSKYTGQNDIVIGTAIANRHHRQTEGLIGFFVNTHAHRTELTNAQSFEALIQQVHQEQINSQLHQDLPFEKLIGELKVERDASRHPIFQVLFGVQGFGTSERTSNDQKNYLNPFQIGDVYEVAKFDLSIFINDSEEELTGEISYATSLFDKGTIVRLIHHYIHLLEELTKAPNKAYSEISLLSPTDYQQLVYNWNATDKAYPTDKTIYQMFEEQVLKTPNNVALVYEGEELSYKELNEKSNQLGRYIREQYQEKTQSTLQPDTLIALCLDRSLEMIIGILAVLKAGGAYVPIDPTIPQERIDFVLEDTQAQIILSQRHIERFNSLPQEKVVYIDLTEELYKKEDDTNLDQYSQSTDLAYVIYTSGTTGKPKGAMLNHSGIVNRIEWMQNMYSLNLEDVVLQKTPYVFDVSVWELLWANWYGAKIVIAKPEGHKDSDYLHELIQKEKVTTLHFVPSMLEAYNHYLFSKEDKFNASIRQIFCSGEALNKNTVEQTYKNLYDQSSKLHNLYGPTEASIDVTFYETDSTKNVYIGKPIQNTQVYVLSSNQTPVPIGVIGELYLGGVGLSRGYLNRPELTAERFVNNPFATEADKAKGYTKLYKTGDLVRWLADGNIEYLGRNDDQVKIRGYRIELGEIEHAMSQIDGINQVCVLAKERQTDTANTKYLVGYYVSDYDMTSIEIQNRLLEVLPDYMVPTALVVMASFPLTINGKLDKRALPDPEFTSSEADYVAPTTEIETAVCEIWKALLGLDQVGITDDFFKIGGNSILAIQASHRMSKLLGSNVKVADVFKYKTISKLLIHATGQSQIIIPKINSNQGTLSFAQERLWFIEQYEQGTNAYHMPGLFELDTKTDKEGIKYALQQIVSRHEVLRSTIEQSEDQEHGIQKVHNEALVIEEVSVMATDDYQSLIEEDINRPFNLSTEYPIRITFYTIESAADDALNKTILLITTHHIASDGWSMEVFQRELSAYYEAYIKGDKTFSLPELEIQYKDYALWQRDYLTGEVLEKQLNYWKEKLSGFQTLEFPTDYVRPAEIEYKGESLGFKIDKEISQRMRLLAQRNGITLNSLMLSSVNILLSKYTGQNDIVIGTAIANRHHRQTEGLIGFFVNTQAHRTQLTNAQSFDELIKKVHQDQIEAQMHQDLPFEKLIDELDVERDASRHPVFQILFGVQGFGTSERTSNDQKNYLNPFQIDDVYEIAKFDLSIFIDDSGEELTGNISYATSLFDKDTIVRLTHHYIHLLEELTKAPNTAYSEISLLTSVEYNQLVYNWNTTDKEYSKDKTIQELFEEQVAKTPNNVAIVFENKSLTYQELNEKSNQLARYIREQYQEKTQQLLTSDTFIALFLDRSLEMVIGILAVLKAGGVYVPIDPTIPQERIDYILEDTQAAIVLSQRQLNEKTLPQDKVIHIDLSEEFYQREDNTNLGQQSQSTDLAYVIYTSGTTGKPKGVMQMHCNIMRLFTSTDAQFGFNEDDVWTLFHSYAFDFSVWELWGALVYGGKLIIISKEQAQDLEGFYQLCRNEKVSVLNQTPSAFYRFADIANGLGQADLSLRYIIFGGEALNTNQLSSWWDYQLKSNLNTRLINMYGITETTVHVTYKEIKKDEIIQSNIGKSIADLKTYILSTNQTPVPIGVSGELYIGGEGLSRGYLNRPDLTAERFVNNPFATEADKAKGYTKLYKTGDLARWLSNGDIEYLGRNDDQVKIRGYRIELGEIEHAMSQIEGIKQVCVLAKERKTEAATTKYLVGYYVLDLDKPTIDQVSIMEKLSEVLPDYMVPTALVAMEFFPLTINGKLDKRALPDPEFTTSEVDYVGPTSEIEAALCEIWQTVLNIDKISITDNFFRIGGDSILSIQVSSRIRQAGFVCQVKDIFEYKTIGKLADHLSRKKSEVTLKTEQGVVTGELDFLPIQQWFVDQIEDGTLSRANHWNQSFLIRVAELNRNQLITVIKELVAYHDVLRIVYSKEQDPITGKLNWRQEYQSEIILPELKTLDVSQHTEDEVHDILTVWQSAFDLEQGRLFQVGYLYGYADGSARIHFALHHMIVDGVSWRILAEDIKNLYEGKALPSKGSSYRQWVEEVKEYPKQHPLEEVYWEEQLKGMPDYHLAAHHNEPSEAHFELDTPLTKSLLQEASRAYHTEINDLLLTALTYALQEINGQAIQGITLEGHGREDINSAIDHSRTVGWFTTMFPVRLEVRNSLKESIQFVKESMRNIPNKGLGFGSFATQSSSEYTYKNVAPIYFNYLGQFDTQQEEWKFASESSGLSIDSANQDHHIISINGNVRHGQIGFNIVTKLGAETTKQLTASFKTAIIRIIKHCKEQVEEEGSSYTPSDFKSIKISQTLLSELEVAAKSAQNEIQHIYPATSLQQGFIYHAVSQSQDDAYRVQLLFDYHQYLDVNAYINAWEYCIAQYPSLRTAFNWEEDIIQIIYKHGKLNYQLHDISHLLIQEERDAAIEVIQIEDRKQSFDLTQPTLLRLHIIKQAEDYYTVLKTEHHSISDGWSGPILLSNLDSYYQELINNRTIRIKEDTAYLQTQDYIGKHKNNVDRYWENTLSEVEGTNDISTLLSHPIDFKTYKQVEVSANSSYEIKGELYNQLKAFTQKEGITINVMIQFIWHKLLHVYSNSLKSIVGTTISGRELPIDGIEESVGLYINTLPLIIDWNNEGSILDQLQQIQKKIIEMNTHSFADLAKLQKEGERLFHSLFIFENYPVPEGDDNQETSNVSLRDAIEKVDYPLNIMAFEQGELLTIKFNYDGNYLTQSKAKAHLATLENILNQILSDPNKSHREISLLSPTDYQQLVYNWNATDKVYPRDKTIYQMFEEQVLKTPNNVALVYEGEELSYKELNEKSNQLGRYIREQYQEKTQSTLQPDTLIALCLDRSLEMIIGILAVLKAGGAYVPIDPTIPQERIDFVLEDTQAQIILSQRHIESLNSLPQEKVVYIDLTEELYKKEDDTNLDQYSQSTDLAYVIYTSGTTGKPKGTMLNHSGIVNRIEWMQNMYSLNLEDVVLQKTPYVFDVSVWELLWANWYGAKIVIAKPEGHKDSDYLHELIQKEKVTTLHFVPSMLEAYNHYLFSKEDKFNASIRQIFCSGEALNKNTVEQTYKNLCDQSSKLHNLYGPTEASIDVTFYETDSTKNVYIGKPIQNTQVYVLSSNQTPVPIGVIGELYLGGVGLSRGYLNRSELTAERFVNNPFATEADKAKGYSKLYKTGDLVRWLADGNIEYLGRNDDQVKIRGYRIELGEIEHAMSQIDGINQVCVLAKERQTDTANTKYLVGYYVSDCDMTSIEIQNRLLEVLPDYMVPTALVAMESFPLTINGKLDKRALPDPEFTSSEADYVAPTTEIETAVCEIWKALLGLDQVGITDDFFKIGGNSILAIQASHRMSKLLGSNVKVADVFKYKTISKLLVHATGQSQIIIPKINSNQGTLSFAQERLWFIEQYEQGTNAYHMPGLFELDAKTDKEGIKYALQQIVSRHEVLRSTIEQSEDQEHGIQKVHNEALAIEEVSVMTTNDYQSLIEEDINRPFNLSAEYPIRITFYTIESDDVLNKTILLITTHHIASDGWSMEVFQRELSAYYEAYINNDKTFSLPELEIQYKDYALWQRDYLTGEVLEKQLNYWKEKLSGFQTLEFPTDYARPAEIDYRGDYQEFTLDKELSQKIRSLAQYHGITLNSVLLSSISILFSKYTGQDDIVIGSVMANRQYMQTEGLIGFFVNTQVNRTQLTNAQSFEALIQQVHQEQINSQLHQDLPFERLIDELGVERDMSRHPVFQIMFMVRSFNNQNKKIEQQKEYFKPYEIESDSQTEKLDLSITIDDSQDELRGLVSYATSLFCKTTITKFIKNYIFLLEKLVEKPTSSYSLLSIIDPADYKEIVHNWNATEKEYPKEKTIQELFEEQVAKTPNKTALVFEEKSLTYQELNEKSNQLAHYIRVQYEEREGKTFVPNTLIALCLDRSLEMIIGMLAVLKVGGAYVPIDSNYPQDRIDYILEDTKVEFILIKRNNSNAIQLPEDRIICIDLKEELYSNVNSNNFNNYNKPDNLAYVIYTSGTTGKPKGVELTHGNLSNLAFNIIEAFDIDQQTISSQIISTSFDGAVSEIYPTLIAGGTLHIISEEIKQNGNLMKHIASEEITHLTVPADLLESFEYLALNKLKTIHVGGGVNSVACLNRWSNGRKLINAYGPTEGTVYTTMHQYREGDLNTKIGKPISNTNAYVLGSNNVPVPVGVIGELHIGGASLSRGYLNRPDLTAERFVNNPFATEADKAKGYTKLYKTGDLVRWLSDGNLEYMGRGDDQVKIRGYRIELGEIEHAMSQIEGIKQVCVLAKERKTETATTKYLVGYYVLDLDKPTIDQVSIMEKLSEVLPDYMVPTALVAMEFFPLTINGKLDKRALPDPEFTTSEVDYVGPTSEIEAALCEIWQTVLNIDKVSITDNFFRIGGDSILSIQVSSRIRQAGFVCQVKDIFEYKTIGKLADHLSRKKSEVTLKTEQGVLTGELDFLPIQQWFVDQIEDGTLSRANHWNQSFLIRVAELNSNQLITVIKELVAYHDVLRIVYSKEQDPITGKLNWRQEYQSEIILPELNTLDVSQHTEDEVHDILTVWQSTFDLEEGKLFQVGYLYGYADGSARIHFALHHMIVDGVSWRILAEDIKNLYEGKALPSKGSSYRQWVEEVKEYPKQHPLEEVYWEEQLKGMPDYHLAAHHNEPSEAHFELDTPLTKSLLQEASRAYHTEINDLLLTALTYALQEINGQAIQGITLEGHGREDINSAIDHSRTVGWFTTMFPVRLEVRNSLKESIQFVKESMRNIPNKGLGFGSFATQSSSEYTYKNVAPIYFNYLGQFDTQQEEWKFASESSGLSIDSANQDHHIISINGNVRHGQIGFNIVTKLGAETTKQLTASFKTAIIRIIKHCKEQVEEEGSSYTPSDFKSIKISQTLLSELEVAAKSAQNEIQHIYPATSLQQGFIYHAVSQSQDDAYRVQLLFDYHQYLDVNAYINAWEYCIAQYPSLRTAFNWEEDIIQIIYKHGKLNYQLHDISHLLIQEERDAAIEVIQIEDRKQSFDLTQPTLLRLHIIKQAEDYYTVLKTEHHSISDGWSGPILLSNLDSYYQELINNRTIRIKEDTAYLQTQDYIGKHKNNVDRYWENTLSEVEGTNDISTLLSHPIDFKTYKQVEVSANSSYEIKGELYNQLKAFTQKEGITINVMIQFIWHKLLHVYSNSLKSIVGTTISGRELPIDGIEESVGLYINTLPLIIDWNNEGSILDQLQQIQKKIIEMNTHSFADLAKLQKEGERLFHSLFIFENYPVPEGDDNQETSNVSLRDAIEKVDYPLNIMAFEQGELLTIKFNYDGNYLTQSKAKAHLATLENILNQILSDPNKSHREISLLSPTDYQQLVYNWNATDKVYPRDKTIYQMFEEQVLKTPNNVALVYEGEELSYKELNEKSNQLGRYIREQYQEKTQSTLQPDTLIALCLDRSLEMIIGILAVLKAGGAYVPIDPTIPQERIDFVLEDTQAQIILSQRHIESLNSLPQEKVVYIDLTEELYKKEDDTNLDQYSQSTDLAYVIYTSGTTGKPKGVMVEHQAFAQFIYNFHDSLEGKVDSAERNVLSLTNYVFDIFGLEYALPLIFGSKITLSSIHEVKEENLLDHQIIQQTPSALLHLVNQYPDKLSNSVCLVGGEALPSSIAEKLIHAFGKVINVYGPAETVIWSSSFEVKDSSKPYIGTPLFNEQLYVLDSGNNLVPIGVMGELYIGGAGLSRGYLNRSELTAERFVVNPFATEVDKAKGYTRLYKTGDLVRWRADGNIEYLGRNDDQVKIRGYRIELGEIEHAISQIEGINQVCVLAKERNTETAATKYLVGYYVSDYDMTSVAIQNRLLEVLPDYMVPTALVAMESFPLTINGKLDKRALPDPEFTSSEADYVAPTTEIEIAVCEIWKTLLGLDQVGITDDFFKIGGNSILALQASHRMSQFLKCNVKVADIFKYKVIKTLLESFALAEAGIEGDEWEF